MEYTDIEQRILDMWPKFEDGSYVWFGDSYIDTGGDDENVVEVWFSKGHANLVGTERFCTRLGFSRRVKRPAPKVLDADGVEIKVGDTVWDGKGNGPYVIKKIEDDGIVRIDLNDLDYFASELFSERPDSWERLEEDAEKGNCEYLGRSQSSCDGCYLNGKSACDEYVRIDLVRRAKALAEKEAGR